MDLAYERVMQWIAQARAAGLSDAQVAEQLTAQGWQAEQVNQLIMPATPHAQGPTHASQAEIAAAMSGGRFGEASPLPPQNAPSTLDVQAVPEAAQIPGATSAQSAQAVLATELPGPIALYRATFANFFNRFGYYLGFGAIAAILMVIVALGFGTLVYFVSFSDLYGFLSEGSNIAIVIAIFIVAYIVVVVLNTLIATWLLAAIGLSVMIPDGQRHFFSIFADAAKRVGHLFWTNIIVGFILSGFAFLGAVLYVAATYAFILSSTRIAAIGYAPIIIGFFVLALIAWIGTYLIYAPFISLVGKARGLQAVRESQSLVHGRWWKTFGRLLAIAGPVLALDFVLEILSFIIDIHPVLFAVAIAVLNIAFVLPIMITYMLGMYNTSTKYQVGNRPLPVGSTIGVLIAAALGWVIFIGALALVYKGLIKNSNLIFPPDDYNTSQIPGDLEPYSKTEMQDIRRQMDVNKIGTAINSYYKTNNNYPTSLSQVGSLFPNGIPTDPATGESYSYTASNGGTSYSVCATYSTGKEYCVRSAAPTASTNTSTTNHNTNATVSQDVQRKNDLTNLKNAIDAYYSTTRTYPDSLSQLSSSFPLGLPTDPVTKASYRYSHGLLNSGYSVCATLADESMFCTTGAQPIDLTNKSL